MNRKDPRGKEGGWRDWTRLSWRRAIWRGETGFRGVYVYMHVTGCRVSFEAFGGRFVVCSLLCI